jgi:hypothetical protein
MSALKSFPVQDLTALMYPASMAMYPMSMMMGMMRMGSTSGLAGATATGLPAASVPKLAGGALPAMKPLGGGGLGAGMAAGLGKARLVGSMSVPPTWQGSMPARMASSAMSGLGAEMPNAAAMAGAPAGRMGMMPMPMPLGGMGAAGMPGGMMGRGGASPHVVQNRPSVVPRTGV